MEHAKSLEIYTPDGMLIFKLIIADTGSEVRPKSEPTNGHNGKHEKGDGKTNGDTMTDLQRRMLFRLMVTNYHLEGDEAHTKLKKLFGVDDLKDVSKFEASKTIERLLEEEKGGGR